jgi:hypothetical protein
MDIVTRGCQGTKAPKGAALTVARLGDDGRRDLFTTLNSMTTKSWSTLKKSMRSTDNSATGFSPDVNWGASSNSVVMAKSPSGLEPRTQTHLPC